MKILVPSRSGSSELLPVVLIGALCMSLTLQGFAQVNLPLAEPGTRTDVQLPEKSEAPAFSIGNRWYRLTDLTGFSQKELRAQFDAEVRGMTDEALTRMLRQRGPAFPVDATASRQKKEAALWKYAISNLLDAVASDLVLASIFDRVVQEHDINVEEYFDLAAVRDGIQRQIAYLDFIYQHKNDPAGSEDKLHAEAVQKFRFRMPPEYWTETGPEFRQRPAFLRWPVEALRHGEKNGDYVTKSLLAHYLVRQACEEGVYYEKAKQIFHLRMPPPQRLEISGYRGSRQSLEMILPQIVDSRGQFNRRSVHELRQWLKDLAPNISVQESMAPQSDEDGVPNLNVPTPGVLYEVAPGTFHIYSGSPQRPASRAGVEPDKGLSLFYRVYAYAIAASSLLPTVESSLGEWQPNMERLGNALAIPGINRMPEVAFDPFVKKPYPDTVFADFERHRAALHELTVSAARLSLNQDRASALKLIASITQQAGTAETAPVHKAYQKIAQRLSTAVLQVDAQ